MNKTQNRSVPQNFAFLLIPGFSLVALSCAIDALRAANLEDVRLRFSWQLISSESRQVESSSGISMDCYSFENVGDIDAIAVCGGERSHEFESEKTNNWLKAKARENVKIGSISDGAYVVANAGLFDRHRSTIHWKCQSAYRERFPDLDIRASILEVDGNRFSCAGGTASLDLMLHFISQILGSDVVGKIADNYFHDAIRGEDQLQPMISGIRFAARNSVVSNALVIMAANIERPLPIAQIAGQLNVSHRQLDRLFIRYLKKSPARHYRELRLARAAGLLRQTGLSVGDIALDCGFQSASHLAKYFREIYQVTPLKHRISG